VNHLLWTLLFSWKQTVSTALYLLRMAMSLHVRTMFGHGISSPNPQRFLNSAKHPNWMSHLFWNQEAAKQPPWFWNWNGHSFQFWNHQILKNGQFGRRRFQNRSYWMGPKAQIIMVTWDPWTCPKTRCLFSKFSPSGCLSQYYLIWHISSHSSPICGYTVQFFPKQGTKQILDEPKNIWSQATLACEPMNWQSPPVTCHT